MPPEEKQKALAVDAWMKRAQRDLALAKHSLTADPPFTDSATFHCQQAVEKALKGFLTWHDKAFKKTHSIAELGGQVLEIDMALEAWIRKAIYLTPYATVFRYPGEPEEPTHDEALEAIELAAKLYEEIIGRLSKNAKIAPNADDEPHSWRLCPLGQHWVRTHSRETPVSKKHPDGETTVHAHCQRNPSHKDVINSDEIDEIARRHFGDLQGPPCPDNLTYVNGNKFDSMIRGWTSYWNEILQPKTPLDPNLVKALVATESSFKPNAIRNAGKGRGKARGLMQVTDQSQRILRNPKGEIKDHLVESSQKDMLDPNVNIAAGVRWLFRKKEIADQQAGKDLSWIDAIAKYKAYAPDDDQIVKLKEIYEKLSRCEATKKA